MNIDKRELSNFFSGMGVVLDFAGAAQERLDHYAATAFSVFHYFREDENSLSRVFGDLLDPKGSHGQGSTFLRAFLETAELDQSIGDVQSCEVSLEEVIQLDRRIDIVLRFRGHENADIKHIIGIENKPWADDQPQQISDYIDYLESRYPAWTMVYLSGDGSAPSAYSIDQEKLKKYQKPGRFMTISYRDSRRNSIEYWLAQCYSRCEADKVRWFLKDFGDYIRRMFVSVKDEDADLEESSDE